MLGVTACTFDAILGSATTMQQLLRRRALLAGLMLAIALRGVLAAEIPVAVAANFAGPMAEIAAGFSAASGHRLKISTGPTKRFYTQIIAGAPFQVLLAADSDTPRQLVSEGRAIAGSSFTYATGRLALWSAQPGRVDALGKVLAGGSFARLAIANPKLAPYGAAAMEVLSKLQLADAVRDKLVVGESVAQSFQFVATGNADLGFVALSQLRRSDKAVPGSYWLVPRSLHSPLRQDAVLLVAGAGSEAAAAFLAHLKSPAVQRILAAHGYE